MFTAMTLATLVLIVLRFVLLVALDVVATVVITELLVAVVA